MGCTNGGARSPGWGGRRPGAGRKPKGERAGVPHRPRPAPPPGRSTAVILRLEAGLPSLLGRAERAALARALAAGAARPGCRTRVRAIEPARIRLRVRARDRAALARAMQGLSIRCARSLNRLWGRRGRVFADRYELAPISTRKSRGREPPRHA